jgi:hypothetical protein
LIFLELLTTSNLPLSLRKCISKYLNDKPDKNKVKLMVIEYRKILNKRRLD